ncbi:MAG TPA: VOC family protein [Candidatus Saccharimonadales bacterium]|nr:VOC family protein [Candidatus Saccharimonadales bacterium]
MAQKIVPNLWFNGNAKEAVDFYLSAFPGSKLGEVTYYPRTKEEGLADFQTDLAGKELTVDFYTGDYRITTINAGPEFTFNQSLSFIVNFDPSQDTQAQEHLDALWDTLMDGGSVLMPLDEYPYSKRYGWVKDKYGLTWQLILTNPEGDPRPFIMPSLLFAGENTNRAEEAVKFYTSLFDSKVGRLIPYGKETGPAKAEALMYGEFMLANEWFVVMDSGVPMDASFNEAFSLSIECKDQTEIDKFWEALSSVPEAEQCGWCKDKFGLSWQIVPENIGELMKRPDAYSHLMQMKKLVIADF